MRGFLKLSNGKFISPKKGDIIETVTGEQFIFIEMKQVRWTGKGVKDGMMYNIPMFRDRLKTMPYATKLVGQDKTVANKKLKQVKLKFGDLFALANRKETFLYISDITKRGGKPMVKATDLASGKMWSIGLECDITKIDINKLKKELK